MSSPASASSLPASSVAALLLQWYDRHARHLPWRAPPGKRPDPYRVWLSEIMLQQTTVSAVAPYYKAFLERWPTVADLAAAPEEAVLAAWAGLGYYARARNLHRCAGTLVEKHGGRFPDGEAALRELPGIGAYTAAAIAAIAFDRPATVVDGNIERVVARLRAIGTPLPAAKRAIREVAAELTPQRRPGDYAQAMMDLGATVCLPRKPKCGLCPIAGDCQARELGIAEQLPLRAAKQAKPLRRAVAFWTLDPSGRVLLRRRPPRGMLARMMEIPSTPWREAPWSAAEAAAAAPLEAEWRALPGLVRHSFTHFDFEIAVWAGQTPQSAAKPMPDGALWCRLDELGSQGLPSVMRKIAEHAVSQGAIIRARRKAG